jgi:hypothetical protein
MPLQAIDPELLRAGERPNNSSGRRGELDGRVVGDSLKEAGREGK